METLKKLHSEEVQEIISAPPSWLIRWGITIFFSVLIFLGIGTWWIQYPDIVNVPFILTSVDAPRSVVIQVEGKLDNLLVKNGQVVHRGQELVYSETLADPSKVFQLSATLRKISAGVETNDWNVVQRFSARSYSPLGEIQSDFQLFVQRLTELRAFLNNGFYVTKRQLLGKDYNDLQSLERVLEDQLEMQKKDVILAKEEFLVQEKLFNSSVISAVEFKREKAKLLTREMPLKNIESSIIQNRSAQTAKQKELLELDNAFEDQKSSFLQALLTLNNRLENWKHTYVLKAPVEGRVSFSIPLQEQQHMVSGDEIMTIEPLSTIYHGLVTLQQANLGKLKIGQRVLVKLDGFPYREYGIIRGKLSQLSAVPGKDSSYWGYVELPDKLRTVYRKNLPYRNGMRGSAEIITEDRRLIERLVYLFKGSSQQYLN